MGKLSFRKGCRNCNKTNGVTTVVPSGFENSIKNNDYQLSKIISVALKNNNNNCEFCDANNFDVNNICIDDVHVFNLNEVKNLAKKNNSLMYVYNMTKNDNMGNASIDEFYNDYDQFHNFELLCRKKIQDYINDIPSSELLHHPDGIFYVCFSGNATDIKIEKLRFSGFSKQALLNISSNIGKNPFEN